MVVALSVGGPAALGSEVPPAPEELAPNVVALVIEMPTGKGRITRAEFHHELELVAVQKGRRSAPKPDDAEYAKLEKDAVDYLLEAAWIRGQAVEWYLSVGRRRVKREVQVIKRQAFKSRAEFRAFLRETHYTLHDVYEHVELQILSTRLQAHLKHKIGNHVTRREEQRAFAKIVREFNTRWRARTVCATGYATERCSNGPLPSR